MPSDQPWPSEWLRGVLEVCVLRVLADGVTYGYAIASRLADSGLGAVKGGTLYPLLSRLESAGLVTTQWRAGAGGPGRKYYLLTEDGHQQLQRSSTQWSRFTEVAEAIIAGSDAVPAQALPEPAEQSQVEPEDATTRQAAHPEPVQDTTEAIS